MELLMKKCLFLLITGFIFLNTSGISSAFDKDGCLTCHQYPGLIKQETPVKFKLLHIDEDIYAASLHGKIDCKDCHIQITEIPHNGKTEVGCTTSCHFKDREKINAMKPELSKFHESEKFLISGLQNDSTCGTCHALYPHSKNAKVRAFLNMHTTYVVCEVCHLDKSNIDKVVYEWRTPEDVKFKGKPYAAFYNQKTGMVERRAGQMSRLTVLFVLRDEKRSVMNIMDNKEAIEFLQKEGDMSSKERDKELRFFHKDIAKKDVSVACNECHSSKSVLDYARLGFSAKRANDLRYMNIKGLVTKYETFVLPNLFGN
jgi:hypothetical protein